MDSPPQRTQSPPQNMEANENGQLTPKKHQSPVQNALALRLKKLLSERQIQMRIDTSAEIDLNEEEEITERMSPNTLRRNSSLQEWFRKRTPKASPANRKQKLSILKTELLERMRIQRREEQESRQRVFKADNEIYDEEEVNSDRESPDEGDASGEESETESIEEEQEEIEEEMAEKTQFDEEENLQSQEVSKNVEERSSNSDDEEEANEVRSSNSDEEEDSNNPNSADSNNADSNSADFKNDRSISNMDFLDKNSDSYNLSLFMRASNAAEEVDKMELTFGKPTNFAGMQLNGTLPPTSSTICLHKTSSTPRIGSGYLLNELPDSQSLDSQTLAKEMQHLMEEQSAITERDNYELLLDLSKLDKDAKKMDREEVDEEVFRKAAKRKLLIDSDDEDSSQEVDEQVGGQRPSGITKIAKLADDLFQVDDGEDRLEMNTVKPFLDTVRVLLDEEEDENMEELLQNIVEESQKTESRDGYNGEEDESVALRRGEDKWIYDEASLSGSDSDDDMEKDEDNQYEPMEGDDDELPQEEELRDGIVKAHMKMQQIEEERHLNKLKEIFDNELNEGNKWDRSFRSRLHEDVSGWGNESINN